MKRSKGILLVFLASLLSASTLCQAQDLTGTWGVSGIGQAAIPLGIESVRKQGDVGTDLGGMLRYGLSKHWGVGLSYENIDMQHGIRVEPITVQGIYSCMPGSRLSPITLLGIGTSASNPNGRFNNLSGKAGVGLEYFLKPELALGALVNYHYMSETGDAPRQVHALGLGMIASYFFGTTPAAAAAETPKTEPVKQAAPPPPPPAAPIAAAPVTVAVTPDQVVLGPTQTQQLNASVAGSANQGITWSLAPALGTVSPTGRYTAPATIALTETVRVTATSQADASKSAVAQIKLTPPAAAPKEVSMEINILFDSNKDEIKPEFNAEIQKVAEFLKTYPSAKAEIEGHTDNTGDPAYNTQLSQRRADSVRRYLVEKLGVASSRLTAKGYGPDKPVADNKTRAGRAQNRRVVATFVAVQN